VTRESIKNGYKNNMMIIVIDWYLGSICGEKRIPNIKEKRRVKYKYIKKVFQLISVSKAIDS
jgi:hypothetical protein